MKLTNKQYDVAKKVITIVVPAVTTAIAGLGELYGFNTTIAIGTIGILTTCAGTILQISSSNYQNEDKE